MKAMRLLVVPRRENGGVSRKNVVVDLAYLKDARELAGAGVFAPGISVVDIYKLTPVERWHRDPKLPNSSVATTMKKK